MGTDIPCNETDKDLFVACTTISLGDGKTAGFWSDNWLNGLAPKMLAPPYFMLARKKNQTLSEALTGGRWMRGLQRINIEEQLDQFIGLWCLLQEFTLSDEHDSISWRITADSQYSARFAYMVQLFGRIKQAGLDAVWKMRAEEKVNFSFG